MKRKKSPPLATGLKAKYTFENFIASGNQWAKAAVAVADEDIIPYCLCEDQVWEKTHLLNAIEA